MSTSQQIITNAIRRLAKTDPDIANAISATKNRGDLAAESASASSGGEENRICCDGSTSSNTNPGVTQTDPDAGGQSSLDASDPANLSDIAGGSLTGLTDCATGEPVCFEGNDWVPPEGWDGPQDPGPDPTWVEGEYWNVTWAVARKIDVLVTSASGTDYYASKPNICSYQECDDYDCTDPTSFGCTANRHLYGYNTYDQYTAARNGPFSCPAPGSSETIDAVCVDEAPLLDSWPTDGCVNLAIKSGTIVGSKYDPENDGTYSAPMSEIELCDGSGNSVGIKPSANGGWKSIDANNPGDGYLYDSTGTRIARISASEYSDPGV